jgi:signal transduction histidine kinase
MDYNDLLQRGETVRREVRRKTTAGERDFFLHVVPLRLGTTNVAGYAIYTDLTEQKERERELQRQNERLDEFASVVSHDLRNPLSIADGYLTLVRDANDDPNCEKIQSALDRMNNLIDDVLALAREGRVVGDRRTVDLGDAARSAWENVKTGGATLELDGDRSLAADPRRLGELLENLFRNAVEHGGDDVVVRVGALGDGFFVEDDGPGIDAEKRETVFEAGYTTGGDGSGLGLAIVRRIAEAHGWSVRIPDADGGARFEFRAD